MWQEEFVAKSNHWENAEDGANLKSILGKAFSEASPERPGSYRKMLLDMDCFNWVCRSGEPRHNRWSECHWDPYYQALVTRKHMLKTLSEPLVSPLREKQTENGQSLLQVVENGPLPALHNSVTAASPRLRADDDILLLPELLELGHPLIWILAAIAGLLIGTLVGAGPVGKAGRSGA